MTIVALEGMHFYAFHGYYKEEQIQGNNFTLDVYAEIPGFDSVEDNIKDTVNYEMIYEVCKKHMEKKYRLIESVAYHIATELKTKFDNIYAVRVRISKLNPPLKGRVDNATVEIKL